MSHSVMLQVLRKQRIFQGRLYQIFCEKGFTTIPPDQQRWGGPSQIVRQSHVRIYSCVMVCWRDTAPLPHDERRDEYEMHLAGYFSRVLALRQLLQDFHAHLTSQGAETIQVLSLGAGFDTSFFNLQVCNSAHQSHYTKCLLQVSFRGQRQCAAPRTRTTNFSEPALDFGKA